MDNFLQARRRMVEEQIADRGVRDPRVLEAMMAIPRHVFVPEGQWHHAYEDHPLPLFQGQTISQPYIVAAMTEALDVHEDNKVLEIGTGSGYQTAILAYLCKMVYSVELIESLSVAARMALQRLDIRNVRFRVGDGNEGWPEFAPYDGIIATAAAESMPRRLVDQLVDRGRIVIPLGSPGGGQTLMLGVKHKQKLVQRPLMGVAFVPFVRPGSGPAESGD